MSRYKVLARSKLGHGCCFNHTIVDTINTEGYMEGTDDVVCECRGKENADNIAKALNIKVELEEYAKDGEVRLGNHWVKFRGEDANDSGDDDG